MELITDINFSKWKLICEKVKKSIAVKNFYHIKPHNFPCSVTELLESFLPLSNVTQRLWERTSVELKHTQRFMMWVALLSCYWKFYLAICIYRTNKLGNFVYARWANLSDFLHVQLHTLVLMDCATMVILYLLSVKFQWKTCIASLRRFSLAKRWLQ